MEAKLDDWKNGWFGLSLGLTVQEVDALIAKLELLRADPEQHFHISNDYVAQGGLGDIEIYVDPRCSPGNMSLTSVALKAGQDDVGHAV